MGNCLANAAAAAVNIGEGLIAWRGVEWWGGLGRRWQHTEFCPTLEVIPGSPLHVPQRLDRGAATGGFHTPVYVCVCVSPPAEVCTESEGPVEPLTARNASRCVCVFYKHKGFF